MKRLFPLLIITVFFFGISGGLVGPSHAKLKICAHTQDSPQFSTCLADDELTNKWDGPELPLSSPGDFFFSLTPVLNLSIPNNYLSSPAPKHYWWLGLGCGGLPA